jgi:hypothetical protein
MSVITELDGRVIWFWPEGIRHWASTSRTKPEIIIESYLPLQLPHLRMIGDWGYVTGIDMGLFATAELAFEAKRRIECEMFMCRKTCWQAAVGGE